MSEEIQEMQAACQICLDSGVVQMADGELMKCPRGCPQPEDFCRRISFTVGDPNPPMSGGTGSQTGCIGESGTVTVHGGHTEGGKP